MLLREEIEQSFGTGPAHRPIEELVAKGRRRVRRRRAAGLGAALATVAVLGATYAVATAGSEGSGAPPIATDPTPTPAASPTDGSEPRAEKWKGDFPLRYVDGELQIRPGVVVHEHLENPYGYRPPNLSDALDLTFRGQRSWTIVELKNDEFTSSASVPSNGWASFADYVADQVGTAVPGDDGWPDTLRLTNNGEVVASKGSEILQRTDDPQLGESFAPPGTPTGAAVVLAAEDGAGYFVVWRVIDGELDVITTPPRDVVGATFEQLLTYARGQYANGEGLR